MNKSAYNQQRKKEKKLTGETNAHDEISDQTLINRDPILLIILKILAMKRLRKRKKWSRFSRPAFYIFPFQT